MGQACYYYYNKCQRETSAVERASGRNRDQTMRMHRLHQNVQLTFHRVNRTTTPAGIAHTVTPTDNL